MESRLVECSASCLDGLNLLKDMEVLAVLNDIARAWKEVILSEGRYLVPNEPVELNILHPDEFPVLHGRIDELVGIVKSKIGRTVGQDLRGWKASIMANVPDNGWELEGLRSQIITDFPLGNGRVSGGLEALIGEFETSERIPNLFLNENTQFRDFKMVRPDLGVPMHLSQGIRDGKDTIAPFRNVRTPETVYNRLRLNLIGPYLDLDQPMS